MPTKELLYNREARDKILKGVNKLADAVKVTLGARGRNVVIDRGEYFAPHITKDGVTVAKEINVKDRFENLGVQMVKEAAQRTSDVAGDGTTTSTLLAQVIYQKGIKLLDKGANPMELKKGMDILLPYIIDSLDNSSEKVDGYDKIEQIGTISANGDSSIGGIIAEAMRKTGKDGIITIEESQTPETTVTVVEGMQFDRGYISHYFSTDLQKLTCEFKDALIFLTDEVVNNINEFAVILAHGVKTNRPVIIIAEDFTDDVLAALIMNRLKNNLQVCAIKAPGFGERVLSNLEDIAALTGARIFGRERGEKVKDVTLDWFGSAKKILVDGFKTTIIEGNGDKNKVKERISIIRKQIEDTDKDFEKIKHKERLARLTGGIAIIYVGALTEAELGEKKDRVEDALNATKAAADEGVVPGGGVALLKSMSKNGLSFIKGMLSTKDQSKGAELLHEAIREPFKQIIKNAGLNVDKIMKRVLKNSNNNFGFNVRTEVYEDFVETGVIDPVKVVKTALINAVAVASLMLTTECMIVLDKEEPKDE